MRPIAALNGSQARGLALLLLLLLGLPEAGAAEASNPFVEAALKAAGTRWASQAAQWCGVFGGLRPPRPERGPLPATLPEVPDWPEEPARIFDQVYFVGSKGVSAFAIDTSEGIIVTDAMWAYDVERSVAGGLRKLGLDPGRIRYVIIPHGHPDHYGGAQFLHEAFGAKIVAPRGDIPLIQQGPRFDTTPTPKKIDVLVDDGDTLTLGSTTIQFSAMPGHTPGGVMMDFPVTDRGQPHRMLIWAAGSETPGSPTGRQAQTLALERMLQRARDTGLDVVADNHGSHLLVGEMKSHPAAPNPFLVGSAELQNYLNVRLLCNKARGVAGN